MRLPPRRGSPASRTQAMHRSTNDRRSMSTPNRSSARRRSRHSPARTAAPGAVAPRDARWSCHSLSQECTATIGTKSRTPGYSSTVAAQSALRQGAG
eukprot:3778651-Rhodomonas_salina.4